MGKSFWRQASGEYEVHNWSSKEKILEIVKCAGVILLFSWFFYRSVWAVLPMGGVGILLWRRDEKRKLQEDKRRLILQFGDCIRCADTAMRAGYSVENAFLAAIPDMRMMHGEDSVICRELERIRRGLVVNVTIEELFQSLGKRSGAVPVQEFAQVLAIAKRSGGSLPEMIRLSAEMIRRKVEAEEEIHTQVAAKKMEQGIMSVMPFGIGLYLEGSNPGYFQVLYHNFEGICIMSLCLAAYLGACFLSDKILGETDSVWE